MACCASGGVTGKGYSPAPSLLFAAMHLTQVFTDGVSLSLVLLLVLETWGISIWWAALVLSGGSIWPAVIGHFIVNAAVAMQVYMAPAVEPEFLTYGRLLLFSLLLGLPAIGLLARLTSHRLVLEAD